MSAYVTPLQAYLEQNAASQRESAGNLQQAGALQSLLATADKSRRDAKLRESLAQSGGDVEKALAMAIQSGDLHGANELAPLAKQAREQKLMQGAATDQMTPDQLDLLGQRMAAGGHPGAAAVMATAEKKRKAASDAATLQTMQSKPEQVIQPDPQENAIAADQGTPEVQPAVVPAQGGLFATLAASKIPAIAAQAKMLQAQMNKADSRSVDPKHWQDMQTRLAAAEATQVQQQNLQDNRPEPAIQTHTDGEGRLWERDRGGKWALALGPDGKPITSKGGGVAALEPEALKVAAWEKLLFGTDPKGLGTASAQQRAQVMNERARIGKGLGLTETEMAMLPQDNKVKMKAVGNLTNWGATVARSAEKLDLDLGVAISYAEKLPLGQIQFINKAVLAGKKEFNDPNANAYASAINSVRTEYSRLMSGPTSNAMLPVEAMKKGNELLSSGVDVPSLKEVGNQMRRDAANTKTATQNQIGALRNTMVPGGQPNQGASVQEFASEADAAKAGLQPGTRVKINGVPGTWQ